MKGNWLWILGSALAALPLAISAAGSTDALSQAALDGTPNLDLRLRYEDVAQDNALQAAEALTLRTRLGYTTGKWHGFDAQVELEDVHALGDEDYNSCPGLLSDACNGNAGNSVVADPGGTELNQFWLRYTGLSDTVFKYGRQRLILDNARFVGNVGWRQNEMTFDAFNVANTSLPKVTINYSRLTNANNIFFGDFQLRGDLVNVAWVPSDEFKLTGYAYLLDFDVNPAAPGQRSDSRTLGLRASGSRQLEPVRFLYTLEYAKQDDYKDSPSTLDADYSLVEIGIAFKSISIRVGYEVLGGDTSTPYAFQTPLATAHAFQGWADLFLNTPQAAGFAGIQDVYLSLGTAVGKFSFLAVYHDFDPDDGSGRYGDEINLQVARPINDALGVTLKYADYNADGFAMDTRKLWLQADYRF